MDPGNKNTLQEGRGRGTRLETLDLIRGITLVSMILYHGMWDFIYLTGAAGSGLRDWYAGPGGFLWQQSICWSFILLSGFCVPFSRRIFRRGLQVSAGGLAVSAVTLLFMYEERVLFGVLSFLGAAMLLSGALRKLCTMISGRTPGELISGGAAAAGLVLNAVLFYMTRWINRGILQLWPGRAVSLPGSLYTEGLPGWILTGLGFPMKGFFSTDYFSLLPWIFLFWTGIFLHYLLRNVMAAENGAVPRHKHQSEENAVGRLFHQRIGPLNWLGEHSLPVYLVHQPVLYLLITLFVTVHAPLMGVNL